MLSLPQMLGNVSKAYVQSPEDWARSVTDVLRDAAIYHQAANGFYRAQCAALGVDPATIKDINDLQSLPLLPVGMFKRPDAKVLLTCSLADVETETRSSGTRGVPSVIPRNSETMTLALVALLGTYREFFSLSGGAGLFLNPSDPEASEMGLLKDLNILNSVFDHHAYLVADQAFDARAALEHLHRWKGHMTRHIIGPPFLIVAMISLLYARYGEISALQRMLTGVAAAAAGLVMGTGAKMALPLLKDRRGLAPLIALTTFATIGLLRWPLYLVLAVLVPASIAIAWWVRR